MAFLLWKKCQAEESGVDTSTPSRRPCIQVYRRHFLLTFCTPEIQGGYMNFTPGKLGDCFEHSGIQGMFLEVPGFQGVLHNDPGFPGASVQHPWISSLV